MTIAFRAVATPAYNGGGTTSITIPGTVEGGDLLLLVATHKVATGTGSLSAPAGWTAIAGGTVNMVGAGGQTLVAYRVAAGTPGSVSSDAGTTVTVTQVSAQQLAVVLAGWSGVDTTSPIRDAGLTAAGSTASTSVPCPAAMTGAGDQVVLVAGARGSVNGSYSWSSPSGYTLQSSTGGIGGSQNMWSAIADGATSGAQTLTTSIATWSIGGQVVLAEAVTGGSHTTSGTGTAIGTGSGTTTTIRTAAAAGTGRGAGSSTSTSTTSRTTAGTGTGRGAGSGSTSTTRSTARTGTGRGTAAAAIATVRITAGTGAARGTASAVTSRPGASISAGALAPAAAAAGLYPSSSTAGAFAPATTAGRFG